MSFAGIISILSSIVLIAPALGQVPAEPKLESRVVIGIFGGLQSQKFRAIIDAYTKPLGVEAVYIEGTGNDLLAKVRAQKNDPQMDLVALSEEGFTLAKSLGLLEKLDARLVPNLTQLSPSYVDPGGYGQIYEVNSVGVIYRTDKFREVGLEKPSSWNIYTNPLLKGRVILFPMTVTYGYQVLTGLAMARGHDERNVTSAWAAFDQVVANGAIVAASPGQAETMTIRGEGWMYNASADRARLLRAQGGPIGFVVPSDGVMGFANVLTPIRGAKNPIAAQRVLNHYISKEVQTRLSTEGAVMPVNAQVEITPDLKQRLGFDADKPLPTLHRLDVQVVNSQLDQWVERFNRRVGR